MYDKEKFEEFINNFSEEQFQGSYADEAAEIYSDYIMELECDDRASSYAREGFLLGYIWARTKEGY